MNILNNLKSLFNERKSELNKKDERIDVKSDFLNFLRQQSSWIQEHIEYDRDMVENLTPDNEVLKRFNIENYLINFDKYLSDRGLYELSDESLCLLLLNILAPPDDIASMLSLEHRELLFSGLLQSISERKKVNTSNLVRAYHKIIANIKEPFNGIEPRKLLQYFKECVWILEKREWKKKGISADDILIIQFPRNKLLMEILRAFSLNSANSLKHMFKRASILRFIISEILLSVLICIAIILIFILNGLKSNTYTVENSDFLISFFPFVYLFLSILVIGFIINFMDFITNRLKKKLFLRNLKVITDYFSISHNTVTQFFKKYFNFNIKNLY